MSMWNLLLTTFWNGLVFSLLAVLVERLLIIYGYARGNTISLVVGSFILAIFKQLVNPNDLLYTYVLFAVIAGPMALNRDDLANTFRKGRWWWKSENHSKSP